MHIFLEGILSYEITGTSHVKTENSYMENQ